MGDHSTQILRVVVGSIAHGLDRPGSDIDYRGVYVVPTSRILSLDNKLKTSSSTGDSVDDTSWEIGHFLSRALKCNPSVLEIFLAPRHHTGNDKKFDLWGDRLRELFPYTWNSKGVHDAFIGYGLDQRRKFLDSLSMEYMRVKFAMAYLRTLYWGYELLSTGTFTIRVGNTPVGETLRRWRNNGLSSPGEVIDVCNEMTEQVDKAYANRLPAKLSNPEPINDFLLEVRKAFWD